MRAPFDPMVSVFPAANDPRTVTNLHLSAVIGRITSTELRDITARIAKAFADAGGGAPGKKATAEAKRTLPGITLAGTFSRRAIDGWMTASGLVQFDLDNLNDADYDRVNDHLTNAPWLACLWGSPSGRGLKGAVRVDGMTADPAAYSTAWRAVTRWLLYIGLVNDPAAKDCARLAFLAHDADAWHNPEAEAFPLDQWAMELPALSRQEPTRPRQASTVEDRALAYVKAMPPSVEGSNGSAALLAVVRTLRDGFDLTGAGLWRCLDVWNTERASPPWSRSELEHALASVEREPATRGRGWLLNAEPARSEAHATAESWPAPTPIRATNDPPPFDLLGMIPRDLPELHDLVDAGAEALQVPIELIAGAAAGLAALACARAVEVELCPGWREPAPLWVLPLLRPGERKSASLGLLTKPFHTWAAAERARLAAPLARYAERRRCMEAELGALRTKAAKGTGEAAARARTEALDLAAMLEAMPARLTSPDLLVQSFTPEGLRDALEANGERVGIVSAEADAAELMGMRYSEAGPSLDLLLCAHAGDPIATRRAGGRTVPLDRPAVGMVLAVQPEAVRAVLGDRAARGRGLIDRMLLILPPSRMGARLLDPTPVPAAVSEWWAEILGRLLNLPWPGRCIVGHNGEPTRCTSSPRILTIDPEARRILWALRAELEPRLEEGADLAPVSGFVSKLPGACARLALAFTMLRDPGAEEVGGESMRAACAWAPFLLAHHRAVLGDAGEPPEAHHARRLWRALQRRSRPTMTARELFRLVEDSAIPSMDAFRPVLDLLADRGAVRPVTDEPAGRGRAAVRWEVHPTLLPSPRLSDKSDRMPPGTGPAPIASDMSDLPGDTEGAA